eukprot:2525053-Amphidinium_carterae.1
MTWVDFGLALLGTGAAASLVAGALFTGGAAGRLVAGALDATGTGGVVALAVASSWRSPVAAVASGVDAVAS